MPCSHACHQKKVEQSATELVFTNAEAIGKLYDDPKARKALTDFGGLFGSASCAGQEAGDHVHGYHYTVSNSLGRALLAIGVHGWQSEPTVDLYANWKGMTSVVGAQNVQDWWSSSSFSSFLESQLQPRWGYIYGYDSHERHQVPDADQALPKKSRIEGLETVASTMNALGEKVADAVVPSWVPHNEAGKKRVLPGRHER